jgi:hypothetical protein
MTLSQLEQLAELQIGLSRILAWVISDGDNKKMAKVQDAGELLWQKIKEGK